MFDVGQLAVALVSAACAAGGAYAAVRVELAWLRADLVALAARVQAAEAAVLKLQLRGCQRWPGNDAARDAQG